MFKNFNHSDTKGQATISFQKKSYALNIWLSMETIFRHNDNYLRVHGRTQMVQKILK